MAMSETFGKKMQRWREAASISQAELARRMDVSRNYVSNLERDFSPTAKGGRPQPSIETCDKIARALGVKVAEVRLAAGYASPAQMETLTISEGEKTRDVESQAHRAAEMMDVFLRLPPDDQARALAMVKILQGDQKPIVRPESAEDLKQLLNDGKPLIKETKNQN